MRGGLLAALVCLAASFAASVEAVAGVAPATTRTTGSLQSEAQSKPSVLVVFVSPSPALGESPGDATEHELASIPALSIGIMSATQGTYKADQMLLDITQGARVAYSSYNPSHPPSLNSLSLGPALSAQILSWPAVLKRARGAPQLLEPGLLAGAIPGGAGYVAPLPRGDSPTGSSTELDIAKPAASSQSVNSELAASPLTADWPLAANRSGRIAAVSFGSPSTLLARIDRLRAGHRLVVADLPAGAPGYADLRALVANRPAGELLGVVQSSREGASGDLLWTALAGLGAPNGGGQTGGHVLTSQTTNERGLVASIDIAPTILNHLGLITPADMRGKPIRLDGRFEGAQMRSLKARLEVIGGRRLPAIAWLMAAWVLLLAAVSIPLGGAPGRLGRTRSEDLTATTRRQRYRYAQVRARQAWALRVGGLALMWTPVAILLPAALEPARTLEFVVVVATCFALAVFTDGLVRWPKAPIVPAVSALLALTADALAGTQLLVRSVLGPDPILGARFYGIGNELKSALAVLIFSAVAAALYPAVRSKRAATTMACAGILLAVVEGSARIGAGVGGVILVSAGTAVATVMLLPGALNRRRILLVMAAPVLGLIALAALDLTTAHGSGHFTGSVLDARSPGDIRDIVVRRYGAAWNELKNHLMPVASAVAVIASVAAVRYRERVCAPVDSDPAWLAALAGGLAAGAIGALTEDSGPVLLVVAVLMLGCVLGYLWGKPSQGLYGAALSSEGAGPSAATARRRPISRTIKTTMITMIRIPPAM